MKWDDNLLSYNSYWKYRSLDLEQYRFRIFAEEIEFGASVLDIGCGDCIDATRYSSG